MERTSPDTPADDNYPQVSREGSNRGPHGGVELDFSSRTILGLAVPALGALVIEPLLLMIDSIMVGSLGTAPLAGLSLASTILTTLVGVFVFLAYATTALTARALGAGRPKEGIQAGLDAMWLALGIGILVVTVLVFSAPTIITFMGADAQVFPQAVAYLRGASFGMLPMLVILAATGTLRGVLDMKTPLYVLAGGSIVNVGLNLLLIFGLNMGILGAGIGLSVTQTLMCVALVSVVVRKARPLGVSFKPSLTGLGGAFVAGLPLLVRTISLRLALLATVAIATQAGVIALAAHQVVNTVWTMASFALDALAIAAQSLVGVALGSGHRSILRSLVRKMTLWGAGSAAVLGVVMAVLSPWIPLAFGTDPVMHQAASGALLVAGLLMPIGGVVFLLDGVLIGASEGRYLAWTGIVTLVLYLPALWILHQRISALSTMEDGVALTGTEQGQVLLWLWVAFAGWFMLLRATTNTFRAYSPRMGGL